MSLPLGTFLRTVYVPAKVDLSPDHVRQLQITIRLFERWAKRPLMLADLSEDLVRQFLADYRLRASASTVNSKRCQLLALWNCAWDEELLPAPPRSRKIRRAKTFPLCPEAWTAEEVGLILGAVKECQGTTGGVPTCDWWTSLLLVIYDTGERRAAVFATRPHDVSLAGRWIKFSNRKNGQRICPLHEDTVAALGRIWSDSRPLLWPWPFSREALDKRFRKILKTAQVPFGRARGGLFHKLRRTSGTLVEAAGGDGARQIGDTREVFLKHYLDRRIVPNTQLDRLPRPR